MKIFDSVIDRLDSNDGQYCQILHRQGWLDLLQTGRFAISPKILHQTLRDIIDREGNRPRGEKLFYLSKKDRFTAKADKKPYRPEEALERFIVASNGDNFFNQIPIGGGKEAVDIGFKENDTFTFVELKPWRSSNSPIYALVESLKNLVEYQIIIERGIKQIPQFDKMKLCLLAPAEYFQRYEIYPMGKRFGEILGKYLEKISDEFDTEISFFSLQITEQSFNESCARLFDEQKLSGQDIVTVSEKDAIEQLNYEQWRKII